MSRRNRSLGPYLVKEFATHSSESRHRSPMESGIPFLEEVIHAKPYSYNRRACSRKSPSPAAWNERDSKCI